MPFQLLRVKAVRTAKTIGLRRSQRTAPLTQNVSHQEESERWQRNCKGGIFGLMSKPALNIDDLSPEERLRLIEELWDSLN